MDPVANPFAPGAGSRPPALAGRDELLEAASIALRRIQAGRHAKSMMLLGLRVWGRPSSWPESESSPNPWGT